MITLTSAHHLFHCPRKTLLVASVAQFLEFSAKISSGTGAM